MNQTDQRDQFEDEIELIDYLRVVWKWKWLIICGTLLCILAVAIYGFTRPVVKMYKVSAIIEIDPEAKLDPLDKIKSMIEYGIFNQQIEKELSNLQGISNPESLAFEVAIPKGLNMLDIAYKTPNPDLGEAVLNTLTKQLEQEYKERFDQARYQFDETIIKKSESIKDIQANIQRIKLGNEKKISNLKSDIKNIQANIKHVKLVNDNKISGLNSKIKDIQANTQQMKIVNDNKISGLNSKIKNIQANIQQIKLTEDNKISGLQSKIKNIQANIQIIEKEFEKNKTTKEDAIITHRENIKRIRENIKIVKNVIDEMKNALQKARLNSEGLAAEREAIILDSQNKTEHVDAFMQAASIQQIINYPIVLTDRISSLSFKEKDLLIKILSENHNIRDLEAQLQILEMQKNDSLTREQDKIGDLEAQIQILEMQKSSSIQREQDKIVNLEAQIQILEMQKNDSLTREQDKIGDLEGQIQILQMQKSSSIQKEQDKIKDLEAQIQLTELKADQNISVEENKITLLKSEIDSLKRDGDKLTGMIVKQPPTASLLPIKYKAKRNALLAGTVGFIFSVFLAFFIEYIKNASKRTKKAV